MQNKKLPTIYEPMDEISDLFYFLLKQEEKTDQQEQDLKNPFFIKVKEIFKIGFYRINEKKNLKNKQMIRRRYTIILLENIKNQVKKIKN